MLLSLVIALLAAFSGAANSQRVVASGSCSGGDASLDAEEQALIALTNSYRAEHGLRTLSAAPGLNRTAAWMVADMVTKSGFSHTDSLGRGFAPRANDCGYGAPGGENIGAGTNRNTAPAAFELFRNSPTHNEIMLSPEFVEIGVGRASGGPYGWYWAVEFGYGAPAVAAPVATPPPAPAPAPAAAAPAAPAPEPSAAAPAAAAVDQEPEPAPPADIAAPADSVSLESGPTLVTWQGDNAPVATVLAGLGGTVRVVYAYNPWFDVWLLYSPGSPSFVQTLTTLVHGEQYWVIANASGELPFAQ